ncbi:tRNA (adenosine(37)-N6)-threonylcarbamoyltransferase complex dimerization subunit type 1 TsaB [Dermatophilus congolensis]|uniref:UGMP family protein n=1 Tax=Dermatophilus congolensis TaxID=1863 RepID=A0A239VRJ5_9MICO|nr:tRNA (adenosine(37)-N6)-threonylcarbamoyltransferase complex dimerization subunit type 1 TsaB [Dermatophilus congolensis]MBO3129841.1 tRNA (adenosine(37)-N6)-threonylcarbamoyltransferase complex dimerization subunit type 1 TsaB [Dermatophilus congolensis]MBO3131531.1 tRNA (adenosine(37)-N6)-threonylcarbamoyltransferase complex dimerization subunit type 1 TsaB [Dermatophilus congolensis]MBO3134316.1 tRNA (adenosine(37)-N6)-threonylcarbamoyltransferase complex dimerization subunit type 1 TsaB [
MLALAIDTSTSAITAALRDGEHTYLRTRTDSRGHAEWLSPQISELFTEAGRTPSDLTHVIAGEGPGPFTGLRVGLVTAETIALATNAQYVGLCSLDALAAAAIRHGALEANSDLLVASDARRKEVYWATYHWAGTTNENPTLATSLTRTSEPAVTKPADLPQHLRALPTVGRGPQLFPDFFPHGIGPLDVDARDLLDLAYAHHDAGTLPTHNRAQPLYLRRPDAKANATAPLVPATASEPRE